MKYNFNPRPPRGDHKSGIDAMRRKHFNPRPPREGDRLTASRSPRSANFNPRPPRGRATYQLAGMYTPSKSFQSAPPREATFASWSCWLSQRFQSAPSAGGDEPVNDLTQDDAEFQSAPSAGGRLFGLWAIATIITFQSAPSAGRATPHGEPVLCAMHISIHALREEGDGCR